MSALSTYESSGGVVVELLACPESLEVRWWPDGADGPPRSLTFVPEGAMPELMGVKSAAAEFGVSTSNLDAVAGLAELEVQVLDRGRVWRARDVRDLARRRRESRG